MLELKNIHKIYPAGNGFVEALKGIDLQFRRSEFVSILGPSGCGKTTMLNIIGGLDSYTDGDLVINGTSTRQYRDRDWDAYRNHSIGFVFQSYNLIPHQTVLQNVEIALTLSGISKAERRARAIEALEQVGLGDQLNKKPGEMSGGQMQRVAIARAIVTNPDIILADEPTGALDTETSVQVMEILKAISKDRLIIMVTHNPELAQTYSTRIIRMLDGRITDDSMPLSDQEVHAEYAALAEKEASDDTAVRRKKKMPSMSFGTSFMLSLKNLFTKKGRTTLTSFAGSIGIIGIALILAISQGMTMYINAVQESTLSAYPLTLEATTVDTTALINTFMNVATEGETHENDAVYKKAALHDMIDAMSNLQQSENDLKTFKAHLDKEVAADGSALSDAVNGVQYSYPLNLQIYTESVDGNIMHTDLEQVLIDLMKEYLKVDMEAMSQMAEMSPMGSMNSSSMMAMGSTLWQELLSGENGAPINDLLLEQYDVVYGSWPNSYDEVVLVLDEHNEMDDITLYALGLLPQEEIDNLANAALYKEQLAAGQKTKWTYEEICNAEYRVILNADCYYYDEVTDTYIDRRENDADLRMLYNNAMPLKVVGIIRPNPDAEATMLTGSICYTSALTKHIIEKSNGNAIVTEQMQNKDVDVLTGLPFKTDASPKTNEQKMTALKAHYAALSDEEKAAFVIAVNSILTDEQIEAMVAQKLATQSRDELFAEIKALAEAAAAQGMVDSSSISADSLNKLSAMTDEEFQSTYAMIAPTLVQALHAQEVAAKAQNGELPQMMATFEQQKDSIPAATWALYYDKTITYSESSYEKRLEELGHIDLASPSAINIYASSFENKDVIVDEIDRYNNSVDDLQKIQYTDYLGLMMSSITTVINAISYVLIAFVSISLIVSSIMIGVITLISVQERTKEIGILRAIGASKGNVSSMFNAETMIVGLSSGLLGVLVTYLLCIPINAILHAVTGINTLSAHLPILAAIILVAISVGLTLISGIIPSRSAAKKDPVVALRSE